MCPVEAVAADLGLVPADLLPWGPGVAKVGPEVAFGAGLQKGRLVLVSAITPTRAGEGKTTCAIGLTQAARRLGARAACSLREPSLGPVFGAKGGGTGGGRSSLIPAERINLHFTGDAHAVTTAHNLLASLIDHDLYFEKPPHVDASRLTLRRATELSDRFHLHVEPSAKVWQLSVGEQQRVEILKMLYRGAQGTVHLMDARCPHRGVHLSVGWVEGDDMAHIVSGKFAGPG